MNWKQHIALAVCLLSVLFAQAQGGQKPLWTLERVDEGLLRVTFVAPQPTFSTSEGYHHCLPTAGVNTAAGQPGHPALPTASTLVRLPKGSRLEMVDLQVGEETLTELPDGTVPLAPITRPWSKESERPPFAPDAKVYAADADFRGGAALEVEDLGAMGEWQLFRLTARPTAYNPVRGSLTTYAHLQATLRSLPATAAETPVDSRGLLVVARTMFREGLQPFVEWKRREGYHVEELYVDTALRDTVKALMRPWFDNASPLHPAPRYVLLVGDAEQIEAFRGTVSLDGVSHITDLYYGDFSGDYLPEALVGRWPVNDTAELRAVVEKTLRYEQFQDMDTLQLKRLLLVAGNEERSPAPLTTNSQVDYLKREIKLSHPEMDTVCYHNPASGGQLADVVGDIGTGMSLLNYTAHCTESGWTSPALTIGEVEQAATSQPTVYVNNCCRSNSFGGTGFGEELLRMPVGGAVGVVGATNSTMWYEDFYWAVGPKWPVEAEVTYDSLTRGAFDALAGRAPSIATMGELLAAGNLAVTAFGSTNTKFYWEIYCLLGDPTLRPWIGVPQAVAMQLRDSARNGATALSISGTAGATVTALQGGEVIGCATLDATGNAQMALTRTLDSLPLILTATGRNLWPRTDTLAVVTEQEHGATLRDIAVGDSLVAFRVENIGRSRIDSLRVVLTQTDADRSIGATLREERLVVGPLAAGADTALTLPVHLLGIGSQPLWQAQLQVWSDSMDCQLTLRHATGTVSPTLTLRLTRADGGRVRKIMPGEGYRLAASVSHPEAMLTLEASDLTTTDSLLDFVCADSLCALRIGGSLALDNWSEEQEYWLTPGNRIDGLEQGFASHPWQNQSRTPWTLDSSEHRSGRYSLRSGSIGHSQSTRICLEVNLPNDDNIRYWVKCSTEAQHDKMVFSIDGQSAYPAAWGNTDWQERTHSISAGRHTICWNYSKDASDSHGSDCVWIDDIQMPLALWDSAYAWECVTAENIGVDQVESVPTLNIYPNPASGRVTLSGRDGTTVSITDALGRTVATFQLHGEGSQTWDTTGLPTGIYMARSVLDGRMNIQKIIIINKQ